MTSKGTQSRVVIKKGTEPRQAPPKDPASTPSHRGPSPPEISLLKVPDGVRLGSSPEEVVCHPRM